MYYHHIKVPKHKISKVGKLGALQSENLESQKCKWGKFAFVLSQHSCPPSTLGGGV